MKLNLLNQTILIIEDYSVMRKSIKSMLYQLGAKDVFEAHHGKSAIMAMKNQRFDIVLCDYNLGDGQNGQQVLDQARYEKLLPINAVFMIVTAELSASFVLNTLENKPDDYLTKPFTSEQLSIRLEKCYLRKQYLSDIEREIDKGDITSAINYCDELLKKDDKYLHSLLLKIRADLAIERGDYTKASAIYQDVLEQRELPWARVGTGVIAFLKNDYEQAIVIFQDLIAKNPMLMECYDWLAKSYEALGNTTEAEETVSKAIKISPQSFSRQKKLAILAEKTGNLDVAEKAYLAVTNLGQHSIHRSPGDFSGLANIYSKNNKQQEVMKTLKKMRKQFTQNPEAELRAAILETEVYHEQDNTELSQKAFEKVIELYDELKDEIPKELQLDIAKSFYRNEKVEVADNIISLLIQNNIDDKYFIDDIRRMHTSIGQENYSDALIKETKQEVININNQGVKLYQQGDIKEAFSVFEKAIEKMPNNQTIVFNMTKITLHNLKTSGTTKENIISAQSYLKRAQQVGVAAEKLGKLQLEFEKITKELASGTPAI